ncbi:hypothetical protein Pan161_31210 [Gimesia algae]|uniref:EamA-like transporter family protein n=1 Tax=Gimesia algae TaxID=2527971 RepID=A0A517VEM8_9PLAN|nr:hypothetical protein Pan161_31210 [Gimesia algae]
MLPLAEACYGFRDMTFLSWLAMIGAVAIAALADAVSTLWARNPTELSVYLFLLLLLGPLVFFCFGLVTRHVGLAVTSGVVNSLLVVTSMGIGLVFFGEWDRLSVWQYCGMALAIAGIVLMLFFPKVHP